MHWEYKGERCYLFPRSSWSRPQEMIKHPPSGRDKILAPKQSWKSGSIQVGMQKFSLAWFVSWLWDGWGLGLSQRSTLFLKSTLCNWDVKWSKCPRLSDWYLCILSFVFLCYFRPLLGPFSCSFCPEIYFHHFDHHLSKDLSHISVLRLDCFSWSPSVLPKLLVDMEVPSFSRH